MTLERLRSSLGVFPFTMPVAGRRRNATFRLLDTPLRKWLRNSVIQTGLGDLTVDFSHPPERFLAYMFNNVVRHYERSPLGQLICTLAPHGGVYVDVGANLGIYSFIAMRNGMPSIPVEPEPSHARFLMRNSHIFGDPIMAALSDQRKNLPLYYAENNPGATSLVPCPGYTQSDTVVPVDTFANLAKAGRMGDPSEIRLVKFDVEGFEESAIRGMAPFLEDGHRPIIWCEVRGDRSLRNGGSFRGVIELLGKYEYACFEGTATGEPAAAEHELSARDVFDLVFVQPECR